MDLDVQSDINSDGCNTEDKSKFPSVYYGVHIPNEPTNEQNNVFEDKETALKLARKHKKSRFKAFQFYHEAVDFSINGLEVTNAIEGDNLFKKDLAAPVGEKASPFRTPRPQELTEFRNKIEMGNFSCVQEMIHYNPRYLVSSGDTPSILQEGARLNALHVAAKAKNAEITEYILITISNPEFIKRLYGDDNQENAEQRCEMFVDLYLNTPNKGFNDTPLHIASKWGADKVVEILLSYPQCDKFKKNKHNKLAEDVICERADAKTPASVKRKIQQLLCDNYYVPLLRTDDNTLPPIVGQPFSPPNPPVWNNDPLSPRLEIHAYVGPMDKKNAETFRKVWKTPPRSLNLDSPNDKAITRENLTALRLKDPDKGLERLGNKLAHNYNYNWKEYWEFLDCFIDITSSEGLNLLEKHLKDQEKQLQEPFEVFSPIMSKRESIVSPITSLCNAFSACSIQDSDSKISDSVQACKPLVYVDKACQVVFANRIITSISLILKYSEREYEVAIKVLETDIKHLELLINSYMTDDRFADGVNFQKVHSRLAFLITKKLLDHYKDCDESFFISKLEIVLENLLKKSDYFSSDDEAPNLKETNNKPTMYREQVVCLLSRIKNYLESSNLPVNNEEHVVVWENFSVCNCIFHTKKPKRNNLSRNSSFKNHSSKSHRFDLKSVSKKLCFDDVDLGNPTVGSNGDVMLNMSSDSSKSDSDDEFYTPPTSPTNTGSPYASDSDDEFSDAQPPKVEAFLEGNCPTKTDYSVFNALKLADCNIDRMKYPTVYRWHHSISLFKKSERERWPSPSNKHHSPEKLNLSFKNNPALKPSWLRVTGPNSPMSAIKTFGLLNNR
ncbi:hypothetical protein ABEB36_005280 [Hypothenemus hampei]|uniref:ANKLE2 third alpha/beta domain-containing protein n=1 Tax=Hypothenemus hampei TaxID=57062 RepID=A0ABD1EXT1_HYPHA